MGRMTVSPSEVHALRCECVAGNRVVVHPEDAPPVEFCPECGAAAALGAPRNGYHVDPRCAELRERMFPETRPRRPRSELPQVEDIRGLYSKYRNTDTADSDPDGEPPR